MLRLLVTCCTTSRGVIVFPQINAKTCLFFFDQCETPVTIEGVYEIYETSQSSTIFPFLSPLLDEYILKLSFCFSSTTSALISSHFVLLSKHIVHFTLFLTASLSVSMIS